MNHLRRLSAAAAAAAVTLLLAGCIKMDMAITINSDDTVDGAVVVAVEDSAAAAIGATPEELLAEADADSFGEDATAVEEYAEDGFTGKRYIFEGSALQDFSDSEMSIVREGDEYVVKGSLPMTSDDLDLTEEDLADPAVQELLKRFAVNISFTFPGEVIKSNGDVDGNTVTWEAEIGEENKLTARASALTADEVAAQEAAAEEAAAEEEAAATEAADETEVTATESSAEEETGFWGSLPGMVIIGAGIGLVVGLILALVRAARNRKAAAAAEATPAPGPGDADQS